VEGAEADGNVGDIGDFAWKPRAGALLDAVSNAQLTPEMLRQVSFTHIVGLFYSYSRSPLLI